MSWVLMKNMQCRSKLVNNCEHEESKEEILLFQTETFSNAFVLDSSSVEHKEFVVNVASNLSTHLPSL